MGLATCDTNIPTVDRLMLFEAFLVFYLLECMVLISVAVWYFHQPKKIEKKIHDPWGFWKQEK